MKNKTKIFFVLTLLTLILAITTVNAVDDTNSQSDTTVATDTSMDSISTEPIRTTSVNKKVEDTKNIEKKYKTIKTTTKTVEVNNMNELTSTINSAVNDADNDEYIINLNEGTYQITSNMNYNKGTYTPKIIINANGQSLTANRPSRNLNFSNGCNITINDAYINMRLQNYNNLTLNNINYMNNMTNYANANLLLNNITFNSTLTNNGTTIIDKGILESTCIIINNKELTLKNVTLDNKIANNNQLIISDDCTITDNFRIRENGEVITNLTLHENVYNTTLVVEVNNGNELSAAVKNAAQDAIYNLYIINLNEGTYQSAVADRMWSYRPNIIINGNNQTFNYLYAVLFQNAGNNTVNQINILSSINIGGTGTASSTPLTNLTLNEATLSNNITVYANGALTLNNSTVLGNINNKGKLIISEDTVFDSNANLISTGTIITNNSNILYPFQDTFTEGCLKNMTIDKNITTSGNFTLKNITVDKTITNNGRLIISDDVIFTENGKIAGYGEIVTDNITKLLPYIETISGNYTITDTILDKTYNYMGNVTLDNCNITSTNNVNYGVLNINNGNIVVEEESNWITNNGLLIISNSNTSGKITNNSELYIDNIPEDYTYNDTYHVINNGTAPLYFDTLNGNTLGDNVKEGDTLDFQGTISRIPGLGSIVINKPVNIITSTNDGRIEEFSSITYNSEASGSNITGLYTYNTQFYVRNAHNMVFDNISNVVNSSSIGWGVGQTSIRENSTNITVKNSYFYTKDNGGSSTFVFGWADNSTLINSIIEADGNVGNLVYLTTYNVDVPSGVVPNSNNKIINNTIRGPDTPAGICWAIVLSGMNNIVEGNEVHYVGTGITGQWGSGITNVGVDDNETSLVGIYNNKVYNNKLYCGVAFTGMTNTTLINNTIYNNGLFAIGENNIVYNNTASNVRINGSNAIIRNNTFTGTLNITSSNNQITDNTVITDSTYTMTGSGKNNTITDNYLKANTLYGDASVNLNHEQNTITNNKPRYELIIDPINITTTTTTITANIYFDDQPTTDINTGRVYFTANGKVLRDNTTNKVIYADVTDGVAALTDYTVPANWNIDTRIQAVYMATSEVPELTSEIVNPTITEAEQPEFTVSDVTTKAGSEVTITVTTKNLDSGKLVLKVNGKTVKASDGKLYTKTTGETTTFTYTVPKTLKAGDYSIKAVYTSGTTKLEAESTLKVE